VQGDLIRRLLLMVPVLFGVSVIIFGILRGIPGDAIDFQLANSGNLSPAEREQARASLGLDKPIWEQYLIWMGGVLRYHIPKDPGDLDPHLATDSSTTAFSNLVYSSILRFKTGVDVDTLSTEVEGDLAQSWEAPDTRTTSRRR
jgi:ABC-type dipeptide/oligopeptide/nickel transport system permease component